MRNEVWIEIRIISFTEFEGEITEQDIRKIIEDEGLGGSVHPVVITDNKGNKLGPEDFPREGIIKIRKDYAPF